VVLSKKTVPVEHDYYPKMNENEFEWITSLLQSSQKNSVYTECNINWKI